MSFITTLFGLPEKLLLAIFAFIALFVVSLLSGWFPVLGNWFWGAGLIAAGVLLPPFAILKSKKYTITVGSIAALLGIGIIVFNVLAVNIPSFAVTTLSIVSPVAAQSVVAMSTTTTGVIPVGLDAATFVLAIVGSSVGAIMGQEWILRKRRKKK